jgi:cell division protein FtsW
MASRALDIPRHLRLVRPNERTPAQAAAAQARIVLLLIGSTAALTAIGLIMVLSASSVSAALKYGSSFLFFKRQAVYAGVGVLLLLLTSRMRYTVWQRLAVPLLGVSVALLLLVLHPTAGTVAGGSARWIALGPVTIQPSEIAKLAVIAFGAMILTRKWKTLDRPMHLLFPLAPVVGLVCVLVMMQPDMGTTLIIAGSIAVLVFAAGARMKHLMVTMLAGGGLGLALIMSAGYRKARLLSFLHPQADPTNRGYQLLQSLIALGSGGWFGVGLGQSRQKWMYVPNAHTDFIFSILGEELGLIGELFVLALFAALLYSGIRIALHAPDRFGRLLAAGIVGWLGLQTLVNLGAVTGLLPVTGVPLPFVSFGGSSLVVTMAAVGILVNIGRAKAPARAAAWEGPATPPTKPRRTKKKRKASSSSTARPKPRPSGRKAPRSRSTGGAPVWGSSQRVVAHKRRRTARS